MQSLRFILAAVLAIQFSACQAVLDIESLRGRPKTDGSVNQDGANTDGPKNDLRRDAIVIGDQRVCTPGSTCTVVGRQGACSTGQATCTEAGTGFCSQTVNPSAETCDGIDSDCDGVDDATDAQASAACGAGRYCNGQACVNGCQGNGDCTNGNTCDTATQRCVCAANPGCTGNFSCSAGSCKCGNNTCANGETCNGSGACVCGAQTNASGPVCAQPNPRCRQGACVCDSDSTCRANETCGGGGACNCGNQSGPAQGPFCSVTAGTCQANQGSCSLPQVDGGIDVGIQDSAVDSTTKIDGPVVDGPLTDVM